ncbi:hypothetical protein Solca_3685 [Sporocytophaga myxococcoides]|uniref:Uncharacterized protein n=1 Tax=Sporocytophaga myxococcoides TaxID=153721 RepID=A0A098LHJ2_9BACT|nr:hypothetical protein [Sporocytophaga myxococcoides]GAL85892.1 hypothetical protein Solca_3685 [Sporocytophaga myxococcoides]
MIEVFKTNICDQVMADILVSLIHQNFDGYQANFDLDDEENILRVKSESEFNIDLLINFLSKLGCNAEVLPD